MLVECCVAMVLLAGAGALTLLVTATTAQLVDESRQRDLVQQAASPHRSRALATPCRVVDASTREPVGPRALLHIVSNAHRSVRTVSVEAWWRSSGFGGSAGHRQSTTVSGWCE